MIRQTILIAACSFLCSFLCLGAEVPEGSRLEIRLRHAINSFSAKKGMPIEAVLIAPVLSTDLIVLPAGTLVHGHLTEAHRVGMGLYREQAALHLQFNQLELPNGSRVRIESRVVGIDNGRETLDSHSTVRGIRSTNTVGFRSASALTSLVAVDPIALMFATAAFSTMVRFSDPEISWHTGAELFLQVDRAFDSGFEEAAVTAPIAQTPIAQAELSDLIRRMPYQTQKLAGGKLSDLTNLVFLGERSAIERAFTAAGWVQSLAPTAAVQYRTARSFFESQAFEDAPMSTLLLEGQRATMTLSKSLGTFSKRHHLRVFEHDETWDGHSVFTASATHDTAIIISVGQRTITHRIDERIDEERAKVFNDLYFTGCVDAVELVNRPWVITGTSNGSGQKISTDRAVAVLHINECKEARRFDESSGIEVGPYRGKPIQRATRQVILTLRNDVIRGNIIWQGAAWAYQVHRLMGKKPPIESLPVRQTLLDSRRNSVSNMASADAWTRVGWNEEESGSSSLIAPAPRRNAPPVSPTLGSSSDWERPSVELSFSGGSSLFSKSTVGEEALILSRQTTPTGPRMQLSVTASNNISPGWALGGAVTIHANRWISHELAFNYLRGSYLLGLQKVDPSGSLEVPGVVERRVGLLSRQFSYGGVFHMRPVESRIRPYLTAGPGIQLLHLTDAPFEKAKGIFRFGLGNVGMVQAAYNFGHANPLEGGGIFQAAFNSGGGVKLRMAKCWILKVEYRNTMSQRPDFLRKSLASIVDVQDPALNSRLVKLETPRARSLLMQQRVTMGVAFTF